MRIKLTHLIGVSLFSLSVAFSAVSSTNAANLGGDWQIQENNTSGGGSTAYEEKTNDDPMAPLKESSCWHLYEQQHYSNDEAYARCMRESGGNLFNGCVDAWLKAKNDIQQNLWTCACETGIVRLGCASSSTSALDGEQIHTPDTVYEEPTTTPSYADPMVDSGGSGTAYEEPATKPTSTRTTISTNITGGNRVR